MIDIHAHILYGVDDGPETKEESLKLIEGLYNLGFTGIIATPHYISNSKYMSLKDNNKKIIKELQIELNKRNIDIKLYEGNEIFYDKSIIDNLNNKNISTLNNTKYILIELPMYDKILGIEDIIYNIKIKGYIPIIAHPERYIYLQKDYKLVKTLKEEGAYFQCNYSSLSNYYGKESKKLIIKLLKDRYVNFLSSDIHRLDNNHFLKTFKKNEKKIISIIGKKDYQIILNNANELIK